MKNIILCGFMGAGKTVVGKELAKIMGFKFVDTDDMIEKEQGIAIKAIFAARGEEYFRSLEKELCKKLALTGNSVISTGGGMLVNPENAEELRKSGKIVFLDASFETICERIGNNTNRPLFQDIDKARALYDERKAKYNAAADYVVSGDMSARKTALTIAEIFK